MSHALDADYLVAGAGLSGLSLAVHLAEQGLHGRRVILVDPRERFDDDRTWCSWRLDDHPFRAAVAHTWRLWRVRGEGRVVVRGSDRHPYEMVPGAAFYALALARIARAPGIRLELGCAVESVSDLGDHVEVRTSRGTLRVAAVFDGRPPARPPSEPAGPSEVHLVQHFHGWFVETERPVFDPEVPTLMDFSPGAVHGVHFVYVLPFGPRRALVEDTFFGPSPLAREVYEANLAAYLDALGAGAVHVERTEQGAIPMTTARFAVRPSPRVYRLGLSAGLAKPSTGYAFLNVQRFSAALAARLQRDPLPEPPPVRSHRAAALDRILLSYLAKRPEVGAALFLSMFERVPPDTLVRFLTESGSLADALRVMASTPSAGLALETFRASPLWLRPP